MLQQHQKGLCVCLFVCMFCIQYFDYVFLHWQLCGLNLLEASFSMHLPTTFSEITTLLLKELFFFFCTTIDEYHHSRIKYIMFVFACFFVFRCHHSFSFHSSCGNHHSNSHRSG